MEVDESQRFFMSHALCHTGSRIHRISSIFSNVIGDGGGGKGEGGDSSTPFNSVKLCVMINLTLRHNLLCFSFVAVLYSMYSNY